MTLALTTGVVMADHPRRRPDALVQVASVQTLARRDKPPADLLLIDEAHHARATTYQDFLNAYPGRQVVGLTATPWRSDGRGLRELFDDLVVVASPAQLIADGYLVPFDGFSFEAPLLSGVGLREVGTTTRTRRLERGGQHRGDRRRDR